MPGLSDILPALHRRSSSIRERIRTISIGSSASKHQSISGPSAAPSHRPYSVYQQSSATFMAPPRIVAILDSDAVTQRLLETILDSPNGRRTLSRLARTCRAWFDPALNVLWRELDSLVPILGLFPAHLLKKSKRPGLGLTTPPLEKDWEKILRYGGRVLRITYDELSNNVHNSVFPIFEEYRPRTYVLPNLQHLTWRITSPENLDRAALFLAPSLQGLVLHLGGAGTRFPTLPAFLADIGSRRKLQSFSIYSSASLPDTFSDLLLPQDELERIAVVAPGALSPIVGKWVAYLPRLKSLQLDLSGRSRTAVEAFFREWRSGDSTPDSMESHTDSGIFSGEEVDFTEIRKSLLKLTGDAKKSLTFPALVQLHLTGQTSNIATFLTHLSSPLTQLEIVIEDPPDAADWRDLSALICERFGDSLTSLRIGATLSSKYSDLVRSTSRAAPAPSRLSLGYLSSLPILARFVVDLPESVIFTAADVAALAKAGPKLEEVRLCPLARFPPAAPPHLSLEDLAPLISGCQRLNTLAVVINAKGASKEGGVESAATSRSLMWLHVGHSWVTDTLQVAILLSQFAPYLDTIKWYTERNRPGFVEANARSWQKVSDILPHLQNLRLTERRAVMPEKEIVVEYVQVVAPRPPMSDKAIDATVLTTDRGVDATQLTSEMSVQATPQVKHRETQATASKTSIAIDAVPRTVETEVDATMELVALPALAKEAEELDSPRPGSQLNCGGAPSHLMSLPSLTSLFGFLCRIFIAFPLSIPMRVLHALLQLSRAREEGGEGGDVALDTIHVRP
ncbi:hypothetical protein B0H15DRAFT_204903 [Mycena belliarum]|uniref:F-box domain-containing protein n=1 Tax=Mycena belliarum TaxID=1033014 RepID=A0AAD6UP53_9AGAR|nr:hypothetical protein B0H15DRAFT_204903 [Mycena belliae]